MNKYDVVALGELLIDFTCVSQDENGYPTVAAHPGGAPANFLAAVNNFGGKTAMIGKVGEDTFGHLLISTLEQSGIDATGIVLSKDVFTTLAFVTLDDHGDREFAFSRKPGADTQLKVGEIKFDLIDAAKAFHFGTLSLTHEPAKTATYNAVEYAKKAGKLITFDPNLRMPLWDTADAAKSQALWGLNAADIIKISNDEVHFLFALDPEQGSAIHPSELRGETCLCNLWREWLLFCKHANLWSRAGNKGAKSNRHLWGWRYFRWQCSMEGAGIRKRTGLSRL